MADIRKEQEREELHKAIWGIADDLRGSVDGWDFKQYVLGVMFYRYISENLTTYINEGEHAAGDASFDYAKMSDADAESAREGLVQEKGFFILPSELFCNVRSRAAEDVNLNETLELVFSHIEESAKGSDSESDFAGLFDDIDVNSNKLGATVAKRNEKLVKLLNGIGEMKLGNYQDNTIDAFGDAYEFLMGMYASIATCIMVLKKSKADNSVLFLDASSQCVKVTNNNKLTDENISVIVHAFSERADEPNFTHLAGYDEIVENDYNLSVFSYVEAKDTREKVDIAKLNAEIAEIVAREAVLRNEIDAIIREIEE